MKHCGGCNQSKPRSEFYRNSAQSDGLQPQCKSCHKKDSKARHERDREEILRRRFERWEGREDERKRYIRRRHLLYNHGLTLEEYDDMMSAQSSVCRICKDPPRDGMSLHVDHSHATGSIRGLLCENCNRGLGMFKDSAALLLAAAAYLNPTLIVSTNER